MNGERNLVVDFYGEHNGEKFQKGIDFSLTDEDLALPIDQFCERLLKPAFGMLLDSIAKKRGLPTSHDRLMADLETVGANLIKSLSQ